MAEYVYNYSIVSIPSETNFSEVSYDIYFFNKRSKKLNVLRIINVYLSFLVCKLPGLTIEQTLEFIKMTGDKSVKGNDFKYEIISDKLRDGSFTTLETTPNQYIEIFSKSPKKLKTIYEALHKELKDDLYKHLRYQDLSPQDKVFLNNTETPFRFTEYTINNFKTKYFLAQKYNIPFAGYMSINMKNVAEYKGDYLRPVLSKIETIYQINANKKDDYHNTNINETIEFVNVPDDYETTEMKNITIASYDIETYNKGEAPNPKNNNQYIFCIGVGFFHLMDSTPFKRFCVITRDLLTDEQIKDKLIPITYGKFKAYDVMNEYVEDNNKDYTTYICVDNEKDVVSVFVELLVEFNPHIITGFNNFGFDDIAVMSRINGYNDNKLTHKFYQLFSTYNIDEISGNKSLMPEYKNFEIKIEGKVKQTKNETVRAPVIQSIDVYKMILKSDPKRFSQNGKLDTMLSSFHVMNPYDNKPLSKTGLQINKMFKYWDDGIKTYKIAKYCCQDAWIAGTLIIERNVILDKLTYATITYTSFEDSIYRADGHRVSCLRSRYGYRNNFAVMNTPYIERSERIKNIELTGLGNKKFDSRTFVGGAVRNVHAYRTCGVVAADFHAQYPSTWIACNIDSSCYIDKLILDSPELFNLEMVYKTEIIDQYGPRNVYYLKKV